MQQYFLNVGDKACCFEDLKPYLQLETDDLSLWTQFLDSLTPSVRLVFLYRNCCFL
jgi:N-terminal acetyltransferase B complex non-catalytic subunit